MTAFLSALSRETNLTFTENDAVTNKSSLDAIVDFYGLAGAMRDTPEKAADLFELAYAAEPQTAVRTLFYLRDVRGGQGEREVFRACLRRLGGHDAYVKVAQHIPFYGRWDDVFHSGATPTALALTDAQWSLDVDAFHRGEPVSLLAKWMPSENASSPKTRELAYKIRTAAGFTPREYRKSLSELRSRIRLLEQDMSSNNWEGIDYSKLPSQAHRRHVKAFYRHTPERYKSYLGSVQKGEQKINVKAVYPHEIYQMVKQKETAYANVAWDNLPDYTQGKSALVMADVSQSMVRPGQANNPIAVSVSLALYCAERNRGPFKDHFLTFSGEPKLVRITGADLAQKMASIERVGYISNNTNLHAAFRAILAAGSAAPLDIPEVLYIISDMEFDAATQGGQRVETRTFARHNTWTGRMELVNVDVPIAASRDTIFETAKREFSEAGVKLPHVVFWNVNARQAQAPALAHDGNVSLVSGLSPTIFAQAVEGKTPLDLVLSVVNGERYQRIIL